jgi:hypothetical protein
MTRLERLYQIHDLMGGLLREVRHRVDVRKCKSFEGLLDQMESLGYEVDSFRLRDASVRLSYSNPSTLILNGDAFVGSAIPAFRFVQRRLIEEIKLAEIGRKMPKEIIDDRKQLLAKLVDAYLVDQSPIMVLMADDELHMYHAGFTSDRVVEKSHLDALHKDGLILMEGTSQGAGWEITIPTSTLAALADEDEQALAAPSGEDRQQQLAESVTFNNHFYAPSNVAQKSSGIHQEINVGVQAGDLGSLVDAMREIGMTQRGIEELTKALEEDERELGRRGIGPKVKAFFGEVTVDATGDLLVDGLKALPFVAAAVSSWAG